jgi:lipopolysaccharide/colanic/teichoic acid biosynthesis glycosyltransferase
MVVERARLSPQSDLAVDIDNAVPIGRARRALDIAFAACALVALSPALVLIGAVVCATSRGGPLFRQARISTGGSTFTMLKFRTMKRHAAGSDLTAYDDDRVTKVGRLLRLAGADELPQLWNVLRGHMTLVGPRPETVGLALRYSPECRQIFRYRPGLTGPTQLITWNQDLHPADVVARENDYLWSKVPMRVALDLTYLEDPSLRATIGILAKTFALAIRSALRLRSREDRQADSSSVLSAGAFAGARRGRRATRVPRRDGTGMDASVFEPPAG